MNLLIAFLLFGSLMYHSEAWSIGDSAGIRMTLDREGIPDLYKYIWEWFREIRQHAVNLFLRQHTRRYIFYEKESNEQSKSPDYETSELYDFNTFTSYDNHPSESYDYGPSESHDYDPSKSYDYGPSESHDYDPSKSYDYGPSESHDYDPSKSYDYGPSESHDYDPSKSYDYGPSESHDYDPSKSYDYGPSESFGHDPSESYNYNPLMDSSTMKISASDSTILTENHVSKPATFMPTTELSTIVTSTIRLPNYYVTPASKQSIEVSTVPTSTHGSTIWNGNHEPKPATSTLSVELSTMAIFTPMLPIPNGNQPASASETAKYSPSTESLIIPTYATELPNLNEYPVSKPTKSMPSIEPSTLISSITATSISELPIPELTENFLCKSGSEWYDECNECQCHFGSPQCTKMLCHPGDKPSGPQCTSGSIWKRIRNTCQLCTCVNNIQECIETGCPDGIEPIGQSESQRLESEKPANLESYQNEEFVSGQKPSIEESGRPSSIHGSTILNGNHVPKPATSIPSNESPILTTSTHGLPILNENPISKPSTGTSTMLNSTIAASISELPIPELSDNFLCQSGSEWYDECNHCLCNFEITECTKKFCHPGDVVPGPLCVGDSQWSILDSTCQWCVCVDEIPRCRETKCPAFLNFGDTNDEDVGSEMANRNVSPQDQPQPDTMFPSGGISRPESMHTDNSISPIKLKSAFASKSCSPNGSQWKDGCDLCTCTDSRTICINTCTGGEK